MPLDLFRMHHVRHLRGNVAANLERYSAGRPWAGKATGGGAVRLASALEPAVPLELEMPDGDDLKDLEDTKIVHRAFPNLTPLQARDPRLWTRLTHMDCWGYMRKRWDVARLKGDDAKKQRYILEHYFVTQNQSRMLLRNGMARLWWYGHLTHDPARKHNPYELTEVLLSYLDIAKVLLEVNMGRALAIRTGFLDFLRKNQADLGANSEQRRNRIRALAKYLNLRGGFTLLDCLTATDVEAMLAAELGGAAPSIGGGAASKGATV